MNDALTSPKKRLKSDAGVAEIRRRTNRAQNIFPVYLGVLSYFPRHFFCPSGAVSPRHRIPFEGRFSPVSLFVAIL
jgi:hypothetical protein